MIPIHFLCDGSLGCDCYVKASVARVNLKKPKHEQVPMPTYTPIPLVPPCPWVGEEKRRGKGKKGRKGCKCESCMLDNAQYMREWRAKKEKV